MDKMLYIAMSGLKQTLKAQAVNTHNLANVSTPGFRADLETFKAAQVNGDGFNSRAYSTTGSSGVDLRLGSIQKTGNDLDIAIASEGYIAVQSLEGKEAYTRNGNLHITGNGQLVDNRGRAILGNGGPISLPPASKIEIGTDGTVSIVPLGEQSNTLAVVDRIKLVKPDTFQLLKGRDGLLSLADGTDADADGSVRIVKGSLEGSNVNVIESMINMISLSRAFETQTKLMKAAKEADEQSTRILSLN